MNEEICGNCKYWLLHWRSWADRSSDIIRIGCKNKDFGMCSVDKILYADLADMPIDGVSCQVEPIFPNKGNCQASLMFGRNFGCIHFKEKESCQDDGKYGHI